MERYFINKGLFDDLTARIFAVIGTFNQKDFSEKTKTAVVTLKDYLDTVFNRDGVRAGSEEHDAGIDLSEGLVDYLKSQVLTKKDFVEGRKGFVKLVEVYKVTLLKLNNHPVHNWSSFKRLLKLIP